MVNDRVRRDVELVKRDGAAVKHAALTKLEITARERVDRGDRRVRRCGRRLALDDDPVACGAVRRLLAVGVEHLRERREVDDTEAVESNAVDRVLHKYRVVVAASAQRRDVRFK